MCVRTCAASTLLPLLFSFQFLIACLHLVSLSVHCSAGCNTGTHKLFLLVQLLSILIQNQAGKAL